MVQGPAGEKDHDDEPEPKEQQEQRCQGAVHTGSVVEPWYEEGKQLIDSLNGVEAYWIFSDGTVQMTEGMKQYAKSAMTGK